MWMVIIKEKIEKMILNRRASGSSDFVDIRDQIMIYANVNLLSKNDEEYLVSLIS